MTTKTNFNSSSIFSGNIRIEVKNGMTYLFLVSSVDHETLIISGQKSFSSQANITNITKYSQANK